MSSKNIQIYHRMNYFYLQSTFAIEFTQNSCQTFSYVFNKKKLTLKTLI